MKILISPDKFKGSLSAQEVCEAVHRGIKRFDDKIGTVFHPLADGGEGTLENLESSLDLKTLYAAVNDPLFRPIKAEYKMSKESAYIEMAAASGLPLLTEEERNCLYTTTFGTGELILDAVKNGARHIYLFVGGSATNDAGIGMAAALGYQFFDSENRQITPIGGELNKLDRIEKANLKFDLDQIRITVVCDVKNPLFGLEGAAYIYGPQKGANAEEIKLLDDGLRNFSKVVESNFGMDISKLEGGGAAGGISAGAVVFLNADIKPGIQTIFEITEYEKKLDSIDLIITGEGKLDLQTIHGKVIHGVDQISSKYGIPYAIICGIAEDLEMLERELNASQILQIKSPEMSLAS
ncbi:MAG: glycerate kinase, partial [Cyclobacteriaceae bacterium]|nr:glycerate kinase [Cyclobacteriaceae bacterium]